MSHVEALIASDRDWLTTLQDKYKISVNRDGRLVSLKYNQIESPMHEPIVQECRGMVVDTESATVLAWPYNKFWNYGDVPAAQIDWSTARCLEKLDGSLMILYWDDEANEWAVASSGTPRAGGSFGDADTTFRDVFWETWADLNMRVPDEDVNACFMFELCTAGNRIVVQHDKPRIVLHGARTLSSGNEWEWRGLQYAAALYGWELVKSYPLTCIEDCLAAADALDPIQCEGFIVVDAQFNRIKIKSPRYVVLHHMKGEATQRRAIELWQSGDAKELLGYFPEMAPQILPVHERLDTLANRAALLVAAHGDLPRKDFAAVAKQHPFSSVAFKLYGSTPTVDAALAVMRSASLASLERMLEVQP